jgi:hypothetical protein
MLLAACGSSDTGGGASSSAGGTGGDKETLTLGMTADLSSGWTRPTSPGYQGWVGPTAGTYTGPGDRRSSNLSTHAGDQRQYRRPAHEPLEEHSRHVRTVPPARPA